MDIVTAFMVGFVSMWFMFNYNFKKEPCPVKQSMVDIANTYGNNKKICKELKEYSINQIKNGNYEYFEVIETIKRQTNDKTRT